MAITVNVDSFIRNSLMAELNAAMTRAAEPVITKALHEAEREMRAALASRLIAHIDSSVSFERRGPDLVVTIRNVPQS